VLSISALSISANVAFACGGFFCAQQPVDQTSEDILFYVDEVNDRVRAVITIQYTGSAEAFSWILPVTSVPEVSFSADLVFNRIRSVTDVNFNVTTERWNCKEEPVDSDRNFGGAFADIGSAPADSSSEGGGGVAVLSAGQTGPYDYVVIDAEDAQELVTWLEDNDFDVPPGSVPLIANYLAKGMVFVAVKLTKDASVGDIAPIVLDMEEPEPCVPIVLTQIAAQPDMPIRIWIAGSARAVAKNWFHVEPNWMRLNWQAPAISAGNGTVSYPELVGRAVDEAAGRAFVTEFAGPTNEAELALDPGEDIPAAIAQATTTTDFVLATTARYGTSASVLAALTEAAPMPKFALDAAVPPAEFYAWPAAWASDSETNAEFDAWNKDTDLGAAAEIIRKRLHVPLKEAAEFMSRHAVLTRIYTQLSPNEMTRDPLFAFSSEWPMQSRDRTARVLLDCEGGFQVKQTIIETNNPDPLTYIYPTGEEVPEWMSSLPWAREVTLTAEGEAPVVVPPGDVAFVDNQLNTVEAALALAGVNSSEGFVPPSQALAKPSGNYAGPGSPSPQPTSDGGCRTASGSLAFATVALLGALALVRRPRRRTSHG
jgi:hypothetical protein